MSPAATLYRWWRHLTHGWPRTNCLFFAVALYIRRHGRTTHRHYIAVRRSDAGRFPHFLYVEHMPHSGIRLISYKPPHPVDRKCPPILFRGGVRWGDALHIEINSGVKHGNR